jgi:hypothetical protein
MRHRNDRGETLRDLVEAAIENSVSSGSRRVVGTSTERASEGNRGTPEPGATPAPASVVVGEVLDTHHPHLPGRVLVRWLESAGVEVEQWLQRERHLSLRKGDRVLVTLPAGHPQWIVTGALGRESQSPEPEQDGVQTLRLEPGQSLRILSHEGQPLLAVRQGADGPVLELGDGNVEIKAARTLRIQADTIELAAAQGGIDLRTEGETVLRARTIRLN